MENEAKELQVHIVYAGNYYHYFDDTLRSFILEGMRKFKIRSVMVTKIFMWRSDLVTKEKMENLYKGDRDSVNNNLESLFQDLRLARNPDDREHWSYFLPKLTEKELKLVERKDARYRLTFDNWVDPDVKEAEMKLSESDSKYVYGMSRRRTFIIKNSCL